MEKQDQQTWNSIEVLLNEVRGFLDFLRENPPHADFKEMEWQAGEYGIKISRRFSSNALSSTSPSNNGGKQLEKEKKPIEVVSKFVGTFFFAGERPTHGTPIKHGQVIGFVESMNVKHHVEAEKDGYLSLIHVEQGQPVGYGQLLLSLEESNVS